MRRIMLWWCITENDVYYITEKRGEGAFARVYGARCMEGGNTDDDMDMEEKTKVLKVRQLH